MSGYKYPRHIIFEAAQKLLPRLPQEKWDAVSGDLWDSIDIVEAGGVAAIDTMQSPIRQFSVVSYSPYSRHVVDKDEQTCDCEKFRQEGCCKHILALLLYFESFQVTISKMPLSGSSGKHKATG